MFGDFNFEGMRGGMSGAQGAKKDDIDNKRYYELLGIDQNANDAQIKKAYRKKCLKEHPDKGGDKEKFLDIQKAHNTLSDPQKRAAYDKYGEEAIKKDGGKRPEDIFGAMFGKDAKMGPKSTKSVIHPISCTLEDLYNGKKTKIRISRMRFVQKGDKKVLEKEKKVIECNVSKGAPDGEKFYFHGEADEHPNKEAGDVVLIVSQQKHKTFKRRGADLLMTKEITLLESLCGVDFVVEHLDGTKFRVKSEEGQVIKPEQIMTIEEKGMPYHKNSFKYGNLFIMFKVVFPEKVTRDQKLKAKEALTNMEGMNPQKDEIDESQYRECKYLEKFEIKQRNTHCQGGTEAVDSDEDKDDENIPYGAQCAQQ